MLPTLESLQLCVDGHIAYLLFDHGKANEMGSEQLRDIERLNSFLESGAVRALVSGSRRVSAKGASIFIAGANVTERVGWTDTEICTHVRWQRRVLTRLRAAPVFHVTVVDGVALGWGTEYLLCCDYRVSGPSARFALPETGLGILPGAGGSSELASRVGMSQALRLGMTGEQIGAPEALRIGLVDELLPSVDEAFARAQELAVRATTRSPSAMAAFKIAALSCIGQPGRVREGIEAQAYEHCVAVGDAAIGRANFGTITAGSGAPWGPFAPWRP